MSNTRTPRATTFVRLFQILLALSALLAVPRASAAAPFNDFEDGTILTDQIPGIVFQNSPTVSVVEGNHILRAAPEGTNHPAPLRMDFSPSVFRVRATVLAAKGSSVTLRAYAFDSKSNTHHLVDEATASIGNSGNATLLVGAVFTGPVVYVEVESSGSQPEMIDKLVFISTAPEWSGLANFDTMPAGPAVAEGALVTAQYPGLEVVDSARARTQGTIGSAPHTQPHALAKVALGESDTGPLRLRFNPPQSAVCLRAGYPSSASNSYPLVVQMSAIASDGTTLLARKSKTFASPSAINSPIELVRFSPDIAFVDVLFLNPDGTTPRSLGGEEVIDTVQYGPSVPDLTVDTNPPRIAITDPADSSSVATSNFNQTHATLALTANIAEENGLGDVTLRIINVSTAEEIQTHTIRPISTGPGNYTINPVHSVPLGTWRIRLETTDARGNAAAAEIQWSVTPLPPTVVTAINPVPGVVYSRPMRSVGSSTLAAQRPVNFLIQGRNFHPDLSVWLLPKNSQANEIYGPGGVNLAVYDRTPTSCRVYIPDDIVENWGAEYEWVVKDPWVRPGAEPVLRPALAHYRGEIREPGTGGAPSWMQYIGVSDGGPPRWMHQRTYVAEGQGAFHLATPSTGFERMVLPHTITPGPLTRLIFKSRLGLATTETIFRVQATTHTHPNEGQWQTIWSRPGISSNNPQDPENIEHSFSEVSIPLAEYAGFPIRIRFRIWAPDGSPAYTGTNTNPPVGWFIDDILIAEQPTVTTFSSLSYAELHGFGFKNSAETDMGWNSFLATYGDKLLLPVLPIYNPARLLWAPVYYGICSLMTGHCNGIAQVHALWNSNSLFLDHPLAPHILGGPGIFLQDIRPSVNDAAAYVAEGPLNQLRRPANFWAHVEVFQGGQISSEFLEHMITLFRANSGPNGALATIRPHPSSYQLAIFSLADLSNSHVVSPYRVRDIDSNITEIDVYDSNWPFLLPGFENRHDWNLAINGKITINRATNTFTFNRRGSQPDEPPRNVFGTGLYAIPNSLARGPRTPPGVLDLFGLGTIFSFGSADSTVTTMDGSQSAGWDAAGNFSENFPDLQVLPVSDTTNNEKGGIPQAFFNHQLQDATLKATVNVRGPKWIAGNLRNGNALYLEIDGATAGDTDQLVHTIADGRATALRYTPDTAGADLMPRAGIEFNENEAVAAEWLGLQQRAGQGLEFEILRDSKAVAFENLGTEPQRAVLKITHGTAAAQGEVRYYGPLDTPPGTRTGLALSSWPAVGPASRLVDSNSDGTWETTTALQPLQAPETGYGAQDSNKNGIPDAIDIALGDLADVNLDGIPDTVFRPATLRIGARSGSTAPIHIAGHPGATWKLQKTSDLAANDWADIPAATGTLDTDGLATHSINVPSDTKVFYRAIVTLDPK